VGDALSVNVDQPVGFPIAVRYLQKAIRMDLIGCDRDSEDSRIWKHDQRLVQVQNNLMKSEGERTVTECMFCGADPELVVLDLLLCEGCREVAYCGKGCQKAHLAVHKKYCGK
jgi:hypothetical protein